MTGTTTLRRHSVTGIVTGAGHTTGMSSTDEQMPGLERQRWLDLLAQGGRALQYAPAELKGDRELVLAAVKSFGGALEFASQRLKADREVVLTAVENDEDVLEYASVALHCDSDFMLAAWLRIHWSYLWSSVHQSERLSRGDHCSSLTSACLIS